MKIRTNLLLQPVEEFAEGNSIFNLRKPESGDETQVTVRGRHHPTLAVLWLLPESSVTLPIPGRGGCPAIHQLRLVRRCSQSAQAAPPPSELPPCRARSDRPWSASKDLRLFLIFCLF